MRVGFGPLANVAHFIHQGFDHLGVLLRIRLGRQVELMVVCDTAGITQGARLQLLLGGGLVRVPNHPRIHTGAFERRTRIRRWQEYSLDIEILQARVFQCTH